MSVYTGLTVTDLTRSIKPEAALKTLRRLSGWLKLSGRRVQVLYVGPKRMAHFNQSFHHCPGPTDVLSFPDTEEPLGDLIICPAVVKKNARRYGNSIRSEMDFVLLHGVLHLLGYTHSHPRERARMERRERALLKKLGYQELPH